MFNEWYRPDCCLEFPRGGSQAIVQALVRCVHNALLPGFFPMNDHCTSCNSPQLQPFAMLALL